jgi:hypothetical protein
MTLPHRHSQHKDIFGLIGARNAAFVHRLPEYEENNRFL